MGLYAKVPECADSVVEMKMTGGLGAIVRRVAPETTLKGLPAIAMSKDEVELIIKDLVQYPETSRLKVLNYDFVVGYLCGWWAGAKEFDILTFV